MKRKSVFGMFLVLLLTGTLTLTSNIQPVGAGQELPIRVGTTDSVEQTLDPAQAYDYFGWCILQQIAGTLVSVKPGSETGADFVGELAVNWNASEDLDVWDFNLREGVTFPDGTEFNATHVKYSFDRAIDLIPSIPESAPCGLGYDYIINRTEVLDTYKVRFYLNFPFSPFLAIAACRASAIVNPAYAPMAKVNYTAGDPRASTPVAFIGPYILSKWERVAGRDVEIELEANPNYWNLASGYPKIKHVIFKFYSDSSSLRLAAEVGDVDMAFRHISPTDVLDLENNPNLKVWWGSGAFIQYLCFQEKRAPFNDSRVRRAVAAALDRASVCDTVFLNLSKPLYSIIPPGMLGHTEAFQKLGDANYTLTTSLLAAAGYDATNKLAFDLWYESSGHYPMSAEQALLYKEALEGSGVITVTLKSADWAGYKQNRDDEIMDAYIYGWYPDYVDPDNYVFLYWASWIHTNYYNEIYNPHYFAYLQQVALYDQARATTNITLRAELYAQIDDIAAEECSVVPLFVSSAWAVTKPNIYGVYLDITQDMRYWLLYIAEAEPRTWTVDDDGPADFGTIQEAINANETLEGHTIFVEAGTYYENVVVNKGVLLIGEDRETTIIDGSGTDFVVLVRNANNVIISGFTIQRSGYDRAGIYLFRSNNGTVNNNILKNNDWAGIRLQFSDNNTISGNKITDNLCAIACGWSNMIIIKNNNWINNEFGMDLFHSNSSTIIRNNITENGDWAISILGGRNIVIENTIAYSDRGILFYGLESETCENKIYHNNFISVVAQVETDDLVSFWDNGYPSGGNYWSDYTGVDADGDGIGDTPNIIDADNQDRYPLMNPWGAGTPVASFVWSPSIPEVDELVTFDASASMPIGGEIVSYEWDFGDGSHATGKVVTHKYGSAGNFTVTLNVTDSEGLWDIEQKQTEVKTPPPPLTVSISPTSASILAGQSVIFTSTVSGGYTPYSYQWYLNGNPVSGATSDAWTFTPTTSGIYYVYLKVTDDKGNTTQSDTARITVTTVPVGGYSLPIQLPTTAKPATLHIALLAILTAIFITIKRKKKRKR